MRPGIITNNRLGGGSRGDTATPEQFVPVTGHHGDWETCMTMNRHWGYNAYDDDWKSSTALIRKLADISAKGGNFLLNVGPTAEGTFPDPCIERLAAMGSWLRINGESIYGTSKGPFVHLSWGTATRKGDRLYLHVFEWPEDRQLQVPLLSKVGNARLLTDREKALPVRIEHARVVIDLPESAPDQVNTVVILELMEEPLVEVIPTVGKTATASSEKADSPASHVLDGTADNRWWAADESNSGWIEIDLGKPMAISGFAFDEPDVWPRLRQRFTLMVNMDGEWLPLLTGNTRGHGHLEDFSMVKARRFRLLVERELGAPGVAEIHLYAPE
jgi:alpha-L-fucosidase